MTDHICGKYIFEDLAPLVREISWSNNIIIMERCKDDLQKEFYIQMVKRYGWTKRILSNFIEAQTYEKYLLSQTNFDLTLPKERRAQAKLAIKDEYMFDFAELSPEVEYALKRTNAPIGVATYQLHNTLPDEMKAMLPEPEEIARRLKIFDD